TQRMYAVSHARLDWVPRVADLARRRPPRLRAEAVARDGPLARQGHAGVQGLRDGQGRPPGGAADGDRDDDDRLTDADARERDRRLTTHDAPAAPPAARRGGDARRAPRRAAEPADRDARVGLAGAGRHVRVPPPARPLAQPAAAGVEAAPDHLRRRRAVPDVADGLVLRGPAAVAADR